jgi:hypothetical protein
MDDKKIKITIDPLGKPVVEAVGFHGVGCAEATSNIEKALAGSNVPTTRVIKPEWHEMETEAEEQTLKW